MGRERLERVCGFRVVVFEKEDTDFIRESVVETAFAGEGVALAEGTRFEEELDDFVVAA